MSKLTTAVLATLALALVIPGAQATSVEPVQIKQSTKGKVFANEKGMTLYTFDKDGKGQSNCSGPCATNWPPLMASADAKALAHWTIIKRADGSMQWAHEGRPLYTFAKDAKSGETTGDGVEGLWHVAKP